VSGMPSARERRVLLRDWFDTNVLSDSHTVGGAHAYAGSVRGVRHGQTGYRSHHSPENPRSRSRKSVQANGHRSTLLAPVSRARIHKVEANDNVVANSHP